MPEILTPTDAIKGAEYKRVALITDGRFSGTTTGPCIGHVEMEAYNCGAIGAIKDASEGQKKDYTRRKGDEKIVSIS
jgi:dihydroxy-acid dehydratase